MYRSVGQCSSSWELSKGVPEVFSHVSVSPQETQLPVQTCVFLRHVLLGLVLGEVNRRWPSSLHYYSWVWVLMKLVLWRSPIWSLHSWGRIDVIYTVFLCKAQGGAFGSAPVSWDCLGMRCVSLLNKTLGAMRDLCRSAKLYKQPRESHIVETNRTWTFASKSLPVFGDNLDWHCLCVSREADTALPRKRWGCC